jgi:tRNA threonylcarbamoyladenosine biosynthesis protein TsaE
MSIYLLHNQTHTEQLAKAMAQHCPQNKRLIIFLQGEIGVGKTTFTRFFLQALGHTGAVKSPTYTLIESYALPHYELFHVDLYRLQTATELLATGLQDEFERLAIWLIEWPEQALNLLPHADLRCNFTLEKSYRKIELQAQTVLGQQLLPAINRSCIVSSKTQTVSLLGQ